MNIANLRHSALSYLRDCQAAGLIMDQDEYLKIAAARNSPEAAVIDPMGFLRLVQQENQLPPHAGDVYGRIQRDVDPLRSSTAEQGVCAPGMPQITPPTAPPGHAYTHDDHVRDHPQNAEGADRIARPA